MSSLKIVKRDFDEPRPAVDGAMRHDADTHSSRVFRSALKLDGLYEMGARVEWEYEYDLMIHRLNRWKNDWDAQTGQQDV